MVNLTTFLGKLIYMAVVGLLFGGVVGRMCMYWINMVFNDPLVEITITIAFTYITFFVAEIWLEVSGVMAVVAMGVVINHFRTQISPEVEHFLHKFWQMTGSVSLRQNAAQTTQPQIRLRVKNMRTSLTIMPT